MGPFDILAEQHRELEERITALDADAGSGSGEPDAWLERFEEFAAMLRVHARLEERYLSPLLARVEGRARAGEEAEDHLAMRELVEELEEFSPGEDEWWARFMALEDLLVAHVREEEVELFPRLVSALDQEEQHGLSHSFLNLRDELVPESNAASGSERLLEEPRWDF
ncbi:hemerythrin domain-containing protein [Hyalangium sp.]|uniref:hemerythrin domain-containing protein n=1 Tax=Hyalangium sp. TaxID=2028555 RepID=UPI002D6788F9|nr:hemerythrin domain-containing protein [Hyalangium sp.]HYH98076.1 hemerythrin domain-containing protein [Hyalangium sp.]